MLSSFQFNNLLIEPFIVVYYGDDRGELEESEMSGSSNKLIETLF